MGAGSFAAITLLPPPVDTAYYTSLFLASLRATSALEWVAAGAGVAQVLLARAAKASNYAFGMLSTALYLVFFFRGALYADAALNGYYLVMSAYGWWHWRGEGRGITVPVSHATPRDWAVAFCIGGGALALGYGLLHNFSGSAVPLWDAGIAATAWAGMWLLARRKVENWLWLNASNAVAIPLYFFKGYLVTMVLTIFLFAVAVSGYFHWRRMARKQRDVLHFPSA